MVPPGVATGILIGITELGTIALLSPHPDHGAEERLIFTGLAT